MKTLVLALLSTAAAFAQAQPATVGRILDNQLRGVEAEIVPLVQAMPADKINFAPTSGEFKGVRTFGEQAKHVAAVLYIVAAGAKGEKPGVDTGGEAGPASVKSKEQIVKFLQDAFAYARGVATSMNGENYTDMVTSPFGQGQMAKGALMTIAVSHTFDHYGQMVVYARMNGIVPPASR
jgi:uncharacterized damage-inducible protein DinB